METSNQSGTSEKDLILGLKNSDPRAVDTLVMDFQKRLLAIAYGITLDHEESREIVQDAFLNAVNNISGFRGDAGLGTWLRRITINLCLNWKRKWKRRFRWHHTSLEPETEFLTFDTARQGQTPESRLREKQNELLFKTAIEKLPEGLRVVFVLNTLEGMRYREIAEELGIKEGTVNSRLFRARQMILDRLDKGERP